MIDTRKLLIALLASGSLAAAGCGTDDAVKRDVRDAAGEAEKQGKKAVEDIEKAVPGDGDGDGK